MNPQEPQDHAQKINESVAHRARSLRNLPGFTTAAVAFVVVVLLGGGGMAFAKWNQSATATINITAGAAPMTSPSPSPTPAPSPTLPQSGTGNIVAEPVVAIRPAAMSPEQISCVSVKDPAKATKDETSGFTFSWVPAAHTTSYVTSLTFSGKGYSFQQNQNVTGSQALYALNNTSAAFGLYILRIQPMNGSVAGDPIYRTFQHFEQLTANCYHASPDGQSPLGPFTANAAPNDNTLNLTWTESKATSYVVTIVSTSTPSLYGTEFSTTTLGATLTFPQRVRDQWGNPLQKGSYYGKYSLRILPMAGGQAGDPVYKTVQYQANDFTIW